MSSEALYVEFFAIVPPVTLTEAQIVILYFFRIDIVSSNRLMLEILVQLGENYEVKTLSGETETAFFIIFEILTNETFRLVSIICVLKNP